MDNGVTFLSAVSEYVGRGNMSLRCVASSVSLRVSLRSGDSHLSSPLSEACCCSNITANGDSGATPWACPRLLFIIETTAHHHQVPRVRIRSLLEDPRVIENNVFCNVLREEVSKTLIINVFFAMAAEEHI